MSKETRSFRFEVRADEDEEKQTLVGHAATFNEPYEIMGFEEVIDSGAFDDAIKNDDVRALWNHDPNYPLGRTKAGTLRLSKDKTGLVSEIDLPDSAFMVKEAIKRGDVDQMSFGFSVLEEEWQKREGKPDLRTLKKVKLFDVSPVTYPANPNTDIALRSHQEWEATEEDRERKRQEEAAWAEYARQKAEETRQWLEEHPEE